VRGRVGACGTKRETGLFSGTLPGFAATAVALVSVLALALAGGSRGVCDAYRIGVAGALLVGLADILGGRLLMGMGI